MHALLLTQCLQTDFVKALAHDEPLPNLLHIGHRESNRLLGDDPAQGPVARFMAWAQASPADQLSILHIRDWHDPRDSKQAQHLQQFGTHCLASSAGAEFVFDIDPARGCVIDSTTLNDFEGTGLSDALLPFTSKLVRVGLIGVWTEAKILFLAYELATRYPSFQIAVCSALTASSSRSQHFLALQQLQRIVGVTVIDSIGEFAQFLSESASPQILPQTVHTIPVQIDQDIAMLAEDAQLTNYLFRDCTRLELKVLDGGFSGNLVAGVNSFDRHGHEQAPHVIKIGPRDLMAKERTAFEYIEAVLGNNAPAIADYADLQQRGAIKYRYASMGSGKATSFQKCYQSGLDDHFIRRYLDSVFNEQLGRFYRAAQVDHNNLTDYYQFNPAWAPSVRQRIEELLGECPNTEKLDVHGRTTCNVYHFYRDQLQQLPPVVGDFPFSFVHGDLNGANIIVDAKENVWLIDFFHTHRGHALKDFAKLENDLLHIYTPINDIEDFRAACSLTDALLEAGDRNSPLRQFEGPEHLVRAYRTICYLRELMQACTPHFGDQPDIQWCLARLRYAVHTLGFEESTKWQRKWALYAAGQYVRKWLAARSG